MIYALLIIIILVQIHMAVQLADLDTITRTTQEIIYRRDHGQVRK